jgi:hypothetical protein
VFEHLVFGHLVFDRRDDGQRRKRTANRDANQKPGRAGSA